MRIHSKPVKKIIDLHLNNDIDLDIDIDIDIDLEFDPDLELDLSLDLGLNLGLDLEIYSALDPDDLIEAYLCCPGRSLP